MTDPDDFAALRAALKAGPTPGPWESTAYEQDRRYGKQEIVDCEYIAAASPEVIARLLAELDAAREELRITDALLTERDRLLGAIPPCEAHGAGCVPHALEWVAAMKDKP